MAHYLHHDDNSPWLSQLGSIVQALMLAGTAICACVVSMLTFEELGLGRENGWIALVSFSGFFALNVIITFFHEMGHALAGWATGRRVHFICVGWLGYAPEIKRFHWVKDPGGQGEYAGYVHVTPIYPDFSHSKSALVSLGGPLMTGLIGALVLLSNSAAGEWRYAVIGLGLAFMLDMVANLIPLEWRSGQGSDGLHILGYLRGKGWTRNTWAHNRLSARGHSANLVSKDEWQALRPLAISRERHDPDLHDLLRRGAWDHGDMSAYAALIKSSGVAMIKLTPDAACSYIIAELSASRSGLDMRAAERTLAAVPEGYRQTSPHYWHARARLDQAQDKSEAAAEAAGQALFIAEQMNIDLHPDHGAALRSLRAAAQSA